MLESAAPKLSHPTRMPIFEELVGERVVIHPYRVADAQTLYDTIQASHAHLARWLPWVNQHTDVDYTRDVIIHMDARRLLGETLDLGIYERATDRLIGGIGLHPRDWAVPYYEIGYWLASTAVSKGYMTEAARLLTTYAFETLGAGRVEIRCDARNERSAHVARRMGYTQEALLRHNLPAADGTLRSTLIFSLLRSEWEASQTTTVAGQP
ncbi:MAG: GNAT family protein [Ktedonobacterales bacterium]